MWNLVRRVVPEVQATCVMPDHIHVIAAVDARIPLAMGFSGLARRRNAREGREGALVRRLPDAQPIGDRQKLRRAIRYAHLNPCRAGLVDDPLSWPFSTHRDAMGLTWRPVGPRRDERFHDYVSSDPHVAVDGTELPGGVLSVQDPMDIAVAVSAVMRVPIHRLGRHPLARSVVWEACCDLCPTPQVRLAAMLGVDERTLRRRLPVPRELVTLVRRVALDPRFAPIDSGALVGARAWTKYELARPA